MNLQRILNSQQAGLWMLRLSKILPVGLGLRFSRFAADRIARRGDLPLVRAIRVNRWVVSGCELDSDGLDLAVRETLRFVAASYYTLFHNLDNPEALQRHVIFSPAVEEIIALSQSKKRPTLFAGVHLSNFDLVLQAAAWRGMRGIGLSLPEDTEISKAVEWQHQFRRRSGMEILPASIAAFRRAIRELRAGGIVVTGIDRPIPHPKYRPLFFGQPACLPVHYVNLALDGRAPLVLVTAIQQPDGRAKMFTSGEIRMKQFQDREKEILFNAEHVLEVAADFIRQAPGQWNILQPVWPDALSATP